MLMQYKLSTVKFQMLLKLSGPISSISFSLRLNSHLFWVQVPQMGTIWVIGASFYRFDATSVMQSKVLKHCSDKILKW